jgi:hypothetical protein
MKLFTLIPVLIAGLLLTGGCKKENTKPSYEISGTWEQRSILDGIQPRVDESQFADEYLFNKKDRQAGEKAYNATTHTSLGTYTLTPVGNIYKLRIVSKEGNVREFAIQPLSNNEFFLGVWVNGEANFYFGYQRILPE